MNRPAISVIMATCLLVGLSAGVLVTPRIWAAQAAHDTVQAYARTAITQTVRDGAADQTRAAAKRTADGLLEPRNESTPAMPQETNRPDLIQTRVDRGSFDIMLPPGCSVDPPSRAVAGLTGISINLPGHGMISIQVFDDADAARRSYDAMWDRLRAGVANPIEVDSDLLDSVRPVRSTGLKGVTNMVPIEYQMAECASRSKGYYILTEFPAEDKSAVAPVVRKALASLHMKQ